MEVCRGETVTVYNLKLTTLSYWVQSSPSSFEQYIGRCPIVMIQGRKVLFSGADASCKRKARIKKINCMRHESFSFGFWKLDMNDKRINNLWKKLNIFPIENTLIWSWTFEFENHCFWMVISILTTEHFLTIESNYVVAIPTFGDWLRNFVPVLQPMRSKAKTNSTLYARFFPRFER